jgi:hypothetical protein
LLRCDVELASHVIDCFSCGPTVMSGGLCKKANHLIYLRAINIVEKHVGKV